jgi:hypothetical protein
MLLGAGPYSSQHHPEPGHHHRHHVAAPGYDLSTETRVHCKIDSVEEVVASDCRGCEGGTHLRATCGGDALDVHLGPSAFVKGKNFPLAKGDEIEVTGSRVAYDGGTSLVAKEVRKGDAVLELRDESGKPLWRLGR